MAVYRIETMRLMDKGADSAGFVNPFTGVLEPFLSEQDANVRMLQAAATRIDELQEEISAIKAFLVLPS